MDEESLFHAALSKPSLLERSAFLDGACAGKPELRAAVEALLAAHEASGRFLDPQASGSAAVDPNADQPTSEATIAQTPTPAGSLPQFTATADYHTAAKPDALIAGRYTLEQKLGEGGMGEVWVAKQTEPVKRKVALKLIKPGMDSRAVLQRFEQERQALAMMDHPNIARILDAGMTPNGQPFFVMELVNGLPLNKFCDASRLTTNDRLELFVTICQAVQHAHQKGVVHRDLKPANILITMIDAKPVPKVIDFGVAKATAGKLTDETMSTQFGAVVGTLEYMSPEQAAFSSEDIDTRADIYSLGVVLYELLTGLRPIDATRLKQAALTEMIRIIREDEPSKPSTRLSTNESLPSTAALRQTEPRKLMALLRGELDWVVMKCLEKQRDRRYETANALSRDIERYLAHEAVEARPPSARYHFSKFLRRNRGPASAAVLVLLALAIGFVGTTFGLARARTAEKAAHRRFEEAEEARQKALASAIAETEAHRKAEKAETETLNAYRASTDDAVEQLIGSKPDLGVKETAYLKNTLKRWKEFANRKGDDEHSQDIRGEGHFRVGSMWKALGRFDEAQAEYRTALEILKSLSRRRPDAALYTQNLAVIHSSLGVVLLNLGKRTEALVEYKKAIDLNESLISRFPDKLEYQQNLANTRNKLGRVLSELGKSEAALAEYKAARDLQKRLAEKFPKDVSSQQELANSHTSLGILLANLDKREDALAESRAARDIRKKLVQLLPDIPDSHQEFGHAHNNVAILLANTPNDALAEYHSALEIFNELVKQFPAVPAYRVDLASTHTNQGVVLAGMDKPNDALLEYQAARELQSRLVAQFPGVPEYQQDLAQTLDNLANLFNTLEESEKARVEYLAAIGIKQKLVDQFPNVPAYKIEMSISSSNYGRLLYNERQPIESLEWLTKAINALQSILEVEPRNQIARDVLLIAYENRAQAFAVTQNFDEAAKDWDNAIELGSPAQRQGLRARRALFKLQAGRIVEAASEFEELMKTSNWNAGEWYDFACFYSVACGKSSDKKQVYADRAMHLLQKAVTFGYCDVGRILKDTDLDSLRQRQDFKKLIECLEEKLTNEPEQKP